jgi:hypothetical protein
LLYGSDKFAASLSARKTACFLVYTFVDISAQTKANGQATVTNQDPKYFLLISATGDNMSSIFQSLLNLIFSDSKID